MARDHERAEGWHEVAFEPVAQGEGRSGEGDQGPDRGQRGVRAENDRGRDDDEQSHGEHQHLSFAEGASAAAGEAQERAEQQARGELQRQRGQPREPDRSGAAEEPPASPVETQTRRLARLTARVAMPVAKTARNLPVARERSGTGWSRRVSRVPDSRSLGDREDRVGAARDEDQDRDEGEPLAERRSAGLLGGGEVLRLREQSLAGSPSRSRSRRSSTSSDSSSRTTPGRGSEPLGVVTRHVAPERELRATLALEAVRRLREHEEIVGLVELSAPSARRGP